MPVPFLPQIYLNKSHGTTWPIWFFSPQKTFVLLDTIASTFRDGWAEKNYMEVAGWSESWCSAMERCKFGKTTMALSDAKDTFFCNTETSYFLSRTGCKKLHRAPNCIMHRLNATHLRLPYSWWGTSRKHCFQTVKCSCNVSKSKACEKKLTEAHIPALPISFFDSIKISAQLYITSGITEVSGACT